jgi:hypothetical protein
MATFGDVFRHCLAMLAEYHNGKERGLVLGIADADIKGREGGFAIFGLPLLGVL